MHCQRDTETVCFLPHLFDLVDENDRWRHDPRELEREVQHERHLLAAVPPRDRGRAQVDQVRARAVARRVRLDSGERFGC